MTTRIKYILIAFLISIGLWSSMISGAVWLTGKPGIDMNVTAAVSKGP